MDQTTVKLPTIDRRKGKAPAPLYGELLIESGWRPTDRPNVQTESWLRANGYAPDRREQR